MTTRPAARPASWFTACAMAFALGVSAAPAKAAFVITMDELSSSVVLNGSGTINPADLTFLNVAFLNSGIEPRSAVISTIGEGTEQASFYSGVAGPASFGTGFGLRPSSTSGSPFFLGIFSTISLLAVPLNYVAGTALTTSMTFDNATLGSLGVTPGTYVWTWGAGLNADRVTLQIGPPVAVPEPASLALYGIGLLGLGLAQRRARK